MGFGSAEKKPGLQQLVAQLPLAGASLSKNSMAKSAQKLRIKNSHLHTRSAFVFFINRLGYQVINYLVPLCCI